MGRLGVAEPPRGMLRQFNAILYMNSTATEAEKVKKPYAVTSCFNREPLTGKQKLFTPANMAADNTS